MLSANEAVADLLKERQILFLRRIHSPPDPRKLKQLTDFVRELGHATGSLESRFEIQGLLNRIKGEPEEHAINYAALRSMQKAVSCRSRTAGALRKMAGMRTSPASIFSGAS